MTACRFFAVLFVVLVLAAPGFAQEHRPIHEVYSMMMFNFTKYVQWPDHDGSGEFVIGVYGNSEVFNTLSSWYSGKAKGSKTYVIRKIANPADQVECHVLFIDKSKSADFDAINSKVKGKNTLLITDKNGMGERGSGINFRMVDNKLKFELNQRAIEASNLKVSGTLSGMAILI